MRQRSITANKCFLLRLAGFEGHGRASRPDESQESATKEASRNGPGCDSTGSGFLIVHLEIRETTNPNGREKEPIGKGYNS